MFLNFVSGLLKLPNYWKLTVMTIKVNNLAMHTLTCKIEKELVKS